jgi:hypothetical protein
VAGNWNRIFGGAVVNDLLVGYSRADNLSDELDPLELGQLNNRYGIPGAMTLRGLTQIQMDPTITSVGGIETGTDNFNNVYQVNERLTWLRGRHTMKFGGSWNYYRSKSYYPGNNGHNGFISYTLFNFTGYSFADFLLDQVSRKGRGSTSDAWTHLQHRVAAFASDDFKISRNLTLNLGLRWAFTSPLVEKDDRQANFDLTNAQLQLAGRDGNSRALYDAYYNGWEPRLGFAYRKGERWVFRGGYGITQYMEGTGANPRLTLNTPFFFESQIAYDRTSGPGTFATGFEGLQALDRPSGQLRAWDPDIRPQLTHQWNLFGEYLIGSRSSINVGYVGSDSKYIITTIDANQPLPGTGPASTWLPPQQRRPLYPFNPDITFLITTTARGIANYNALQTTFKQRLSRGLDFNANYTWSKALTNSRGFFGSGGVAQGTSTSTPVNSRDLDSNYGPAFFDATHLFSMAGNYDLPFGKDRLGLEPRPRCRGGGVGGPVRCDRAQWLPDHRARQLVAFAAGLPLDRAAGPNRQRQGRQPDAGAVDRSRGVRLSAAGPVRQLGDRHPARAGLLECRRHDRQEGGDGWIAPRVDSRRILQCFQSPELRTAAGEHPEHDFRHDHEHRQRSPCRAAGREVRVLARGSLVLTTRASRSPGL